MRIYFPQWQGSGNGISIEKGAKVIFNYLNDDSIVQVPLSNLDAGPNGTQKYQINNFEAIDEQLIRFRDFVEKTNPERIQTIGGDCGLEIVPVSYLNNKYRNLGVIWFDAHADINTPSDSPSCNFHGMPLRTLLGEGETSMGDLMFSHIVDTQIHYIGLRDIDESEQKRIEKGNIYAPKQIDIQHLTKTLAEKGITHLYLHFDFDCLDPAEYEKTYYQVPNGLRIKETETCIKTLQKEFTIVGSSVLESISTNISELQPIEKIITLLMK
ncbi:MAG: arginase family protein [Bacteroidota bacterium]